MHNKNTTASGAAGDSLLLCASDLQHSAIYDNPHEMVDCVRAVANRITALAASTPPVSITLDFKQATELLGMYGGEPTEVTLMVGNGHSGKGVYAHWTSVPEEGAMFLGASNDEAAPVAPTQPDWRELCRRLYVELFHCDKQMTCSLNEDGEPIWRTGPEVRDVLSDAKAALEANPITPEAAPVAPAPQPAAPLTDTFVQTVPDKCDRIVWRNNYYHLPITQPAPLQQGEYLPLPECDATTIGLGAVWNRHGVRAAIDADRAARGAAQAAPDAVEELIRERDHRDEIIDALCDAVLEDCPEWSSDYYFEDAVVAVQERIAELEAREECRDSNAQAAPAPVAEDAEDDAQGEIDLFNTLNKTCGNTTTAYAKELWRAGYRKVSPAIDARAQQEGGAKP